MAIGYVFAPKQGKIRKQPDLAPEKEKRPPF
jgi:hypothetical protein